MLPELGAVDVRSIKEKTTGAKDRGTYVKWKDEDRFIIGDYARKNGNSAALRKFKSKFPGLKESTIRTFKSRVVKEITDASKEKRAVVQRLPKYSLKTGRPLLLGDIDQMVQTYIKSVSSRGGLITSTLANAAAKALMARYPNMIANIDIDSSSWAKSLFRRMGFVRRMKTSSKVTIPDGARKEIEFLFQHQIVSAIEEHDIPCSMIINIDQTPLKYVPTGNFTLAAKGSTTVTMEGGSDKRCITGTFGVTFTNKFLPIQLIYGGKTEQSLPRFKFPTEFSTSVNPTHYSNATESIKLIEEIIVPYLKEERKKLGLEISHKGLLIMDVFTGQMTTEVLDVITKNNIVVVNVPANMTKFYQPLDLTVNGHAKRFFKSKFSAWYADQISKQLNEGVKIDEVDVKFRLTTMKPLHAQWVVDFYNEMTTCKGSKIIESGWRAAGISDAIRLGSKGLPPIDPFQAIDPLLEKNAAEEYKQLQAICGLTIDEQQIGYSPPINDEDDEDDEEYIDFERSAFDAFVEIEDDEN